MRFPLSTDQFWRLPRHPDWKYERIDGQAVLSWRPKPLHLIRPVGIPVRAVTPADVEAREWDPGRDRAAITALLLKVWAEEDPYRTLEEPGAQMQTEIARSLQHDPLTVVATDSQGVSATALAMSSASGPPVLSWLTVRRDARERGLATALLGVIVDALSARGEVELASAASCTNVASLRWHLTRGFQLAPDPLREVLRGSD